MINILFWNIGKKDLKPEITKLIENYNPLIFIIAENSIDNNILIEYINKYSRIKYKILPKNNRDTTILVQEQVRYIPIVITSRQLISIEYEFNDLKYLIFAIHMNSKMYQNSDGQCNISRSIIDEINKIEKEKNNSNTIVIGDFNMNPFESGMVFPDAFNAVSSKNIALKKERIISETNRKYKYFYNPMWSYLGDLSKHSPGTYYFKENSHRNHFRWNMFDQILIRPELIDKIDENSIEIINEKEVSIKLSPNMKNEFITPSDHLPLFIKFN